MAPEPLKMTTCREENDMTLRARVSLLLLGLHLLILCARAAAAPAPSYLSSARLVQAAPGRLLELIDLYTARAPLYQASGDEPPFWMRHSQGDRWDLMLLFPMSSHAEYYRPDRIEKRKK